jgi:hypothetical protein
MEVTIASCGKGIWNNNKNTSKIPVAEIKFLRYVISGFRCGVYEIFTLLGCYKASTGNLLPTFRNRLSRNISKELQMYTA